MQTWKPPKYIASPGPSFIIVQGSPVQILRNPDNLYFLSMLNMRWAEPILAELWSICVRIFANQMGVQIMELAIPAMNPDAISSAYLGKFSLFVICTKVSKTVNSIAVATPMNIYMDDAPLQNVLKNPPLLSMSSLRQSMLISLLSCSLVLRRSRGMPVVTRDQPARLPEINQIATSSISALIPKKNYSLPDYKFHATDSTNTLFKSNKPNKYLRKYPINHLRYYLQLDENYQIKGVCNVSPNAMNNPLQPTYFQMIN